MPTSRPLRILVVDDDPAMVGAITALVGTEGHQVITAYDGLTAVKRFREEAPDLVLLDLAMPGPDGFTVAGQIRAAGSAPILVVSGESAEEAKVKALGIGADDYLVKPFGKAELLARIAAVMRRADAAAGTGEGGGGPLEAGPLTIDPPARGADWIGGAQPDRDRISPARGPRQGRRRRRPAPPAGPRRLAGRGGSGPPLAEAAHRPAPGQGPQGRRTGCRRGPLGRLSHRRLTPRRGRRKAGPCGRWGREVRTRRVGGGPARFAPEAPDKCSPGGRTSGNWRRRRTLWRELVPARAWPGMIHRTDLAV